MVLDVLAQLPAVALNVLVGSLGNAVPLFFIVVIAGWLRKRLAQTNEWSWLRSAFASTFLVVLVLVNAVYWLPLLDAQDEIDLGELPSEFKPEPLEIGWQLAVQFGRLFIVSLILALLLLPLDFVGLWLFDAIQRRGLKNYFAAAFLATYLTLALTSFLVIQFAPWIITGVLYLVFFGLG